MNIKDSHSKLTPTKSTTDLFPALATYDNTVAMLKYNAEKYSHEIALREKDYGIWKQYTWLECQQKVEKLALGLKAIGVQKGDVVLIIGDNRPHWLLSEFAVHACGAYSMGVYRDALEEEIEYLVNFSSAKYVIAEDEEQIDKFLDISEQRIKQLIYDDPRGLRKYDDQRLMSLDELIDKGVQYCTDHKFDDAKQHYADLIGEIQTDDVAMLCTTSGTTSNPKLTMITHKALLNHCARYLQKDWRDSSDEYISTLPLSWIMEQIYVVGFFLLSRMKVNFVEETETTMHDLREIGPTFLLFSPRLWEQIAGDVRAKMLDSSPLKQKLFDFALKSGLAALEKGKRSVLADWLLFRALRDRLGLSFVRSAATGGAALGPDTFKFFLAMGVPLRQLYGQTEALGAFTLHQEKDVNFDSVGYPFEEVEIIIREPDSEGVGEIMTRHPNMMLGYFNNEKATKEAFDEDGWMYSGDAGYFDDKKHLIILDRISDLSVTASGKRYSPQFIENKLKFSPFIAEAVILGDGREYLTAIICIRYPVTSKWAEKNKISYTNYSDLASKDEVYALIKKEVEGINTTLPDVQKIKKFILLYKELDADDGELTRTNKVRRKVIVQKYSDIIDTLYGDDTHVDIDTVIHFQDGSKQRIITTLPIENLSDTSAEVSVA